MKILSVGIFFAILCLEVFGDDDDDPICGFPGSPAYGFVRPESDAYSEGEYVKYTCRVGYILIGPSMSRCTESGSWSEGVPVCDDSMTTLGVTFSTPTVPGHSAELAIDRSRETCTYLKPKKPRWWRIDLGKEHKVMTVAVTMNDLDKYVKFVVYVIQTEGTDASYKICASFSGKFGTPTIVLPCALEESRGIEGQKVHIEDQNPMDGLFEICEIEVQVEKDTGYDCGKPSSSLHSIVNRLDDDMAEYDCTQGYRLQGQDRRTCESSGEWSGDPPDCDPIVCDDLEELENGKIRMSEEFDGPPLEGAVVIYKCDPGYRISGPKTRDCLEDGSWTGKIPQCKVIRCPIPDGKDVNGFYRLINQTNSMGSLALLRCKGSKIEGNNHYIECLESGQWTEAEAHCVLPARALFEEREQPRIENQGAVIFGMVVAAIMIVVVLVAMYLYSQKRKNGVKPELPSRTFEPPIPPPRPPPRDDGGAFKAAFMGLICGEDTDPDSQKGWKTRSLPSNHPNSEQYSPTSAFLDKLAKVKDEPVLVEVEVQHQNDSPVPRAGEAGLENVILNVDDRDSKTGSPLRHPNSADDYAAVDYEKKRESRLLKDSVSPGATPTDDSQRQETSPPPTPPKHETASEEESEEESEDEETKEEEERKAKEEEDRKAKEEEERKAKEEEERKEKERKEQEEKKAKEDANKNKAPATRRRLREPAPVEEEKPVLRRLRRLQ